MLAGGPMKSSDPITRRDCLAIVPALAMSPAFAAAAHHPGWSSVQAALDGFVRERSAPGVAMAICRDNAKPAYPCAGTIAFDSQQPFDADSICRLYSMTKNVTRIATLLLVEDGKITLDQPVTDYLPEFRHLRVLDDPAGGLDSHPA